MKTLDRVKLIQTLSGVVAGLSMRNENIEQSMCFVFKDDKVITFNEEIMCMAKCKIGFEGAVPAAPFLNLLARMNDESVDIGTSGDNVVVKGKRKKAVILFDLKVTLPVKQVEDPGHWKKVPENFPEAIATVVDCCSNHDLKFELTCVHITPKFVEASDNIQCARAEVGLNIKKDFLVKSDAARQLISRKLVEFSESDNWLHFKDDSGCMISCRRYVEKYPNYDSVFKPDGLVPFKIPSGLKEAVDRASVFTAALESATAGRQLVDVSIGEGMLTLSGAGTSGRYSEEQKIKYKGKTLAFAVSPAVLKSVAAQKNKASLNSQKLVVDGDGWRMVFCLFEKSSKEE